MAEGEQAEGAAEGGEVASAPKGKLKLIIMVVGLFAVLTPNPAPAIPQEQTVYVTRTGKQ